MTQILALIAIMVGFGLLFPHRGTHPVMARTRQILGVVVLAGVAGLIYWS
jgi:hypothetical protein